MALLQRVPFQFVTQQRKHPIETSDSKYVSFWTSRCRPQQPEAKLTDKLPSLRKGRLADLIKASYFNSHFTSDFPGDQKRVGLSGTSVLTRLQAQCCVLDSAPRTHCRASALVLLQGRLDKKSHILNF